MKKLFLLLLVLPFIAYGMNNEQLTSRQKLSISFLCNSEEAENSSNFQLGSKRPNPSLHKQKDTNTETPKKRNKPSITFEIGPIHRTHTDTTPDLYKAECMHCGFTPDDSRDSFNVKRGLIKHFKDEHNITITATHPDTTACLLEPKFQTRWLFVCNHGNCSNKKIYGYGIERLGKNAARQHFRRIHKDLPTNTVDFENLPLKQEIVRNNKKGTKALFFSCPFSTECKKIFRVSLTPRWKGHIHNMLKNHLKIIKHVGNTLDHIEGKKIVFSYVTQDVKRELKSSSE